MNISLIIPRFCNRFRFSINPPNWRRTLATFFIYNQVNGYIIGHFDADHDIIIKNRIIKVETTVNLLLYGTTNVFLVEVSKYMKNYSHPDRGMAAALLAVNYHDNDNNIKIKYQGGLIIKKTYNLKILFYII